MNEQELTYCEFLKRAKNYNNFIKLNANEILQAFSLNAFSCNFWPIAIYIIDYTSYKYLHVDPIFNDLLGYSDSFLSKAGPGFVINRLHPEDFEIMDKYIFPKNINYLFKKKIAITSNILFTITYRVKNKQGYYQQICQKSCFICSKQANIPIAEVGSIMNITPFKTDYRVLHMIEDINSPGVMDQNDNAISYYYPKNCQNKLSRREVDILKWVCDGCSSKLIADKLHLSIHTINNHRKNMLQKTNCKNISELLNHSLKKGIL